MKKFLFSVIAGLVLFCSFPFHSFAALGGNYTINGGAAASATNYVTFMAAVSDLNFGSRTDGGPVNGPNINAAVVFTIAAGTYNEAISLYALTGVSATRTITFDGVDPATRILSTSSFVAGEATKGLANAMSETGIPVAFGVITTDNIEQAIERAGSKMGNKGWESAATAIETANVLRKIRKQS